MSTRTEYRKERFNLLKECILLLMDMLTWDKKELESIHISFFKKLKKILAERQYEKITHLSF